MFLDIQEQIKNQKLSDYEIIDFLLDYMIDRIMDCIKYTKFRTQQLKDII